MQTTTIENQAMTKQELVKVLLENHKEKLPLWYCQLNCFEIPSGFPATINKHDTDKESFNDPQNRMVFHAVGEALGEKEQSRAWWIIKLKRTEKEWSEWWENREPL